MPQNHYTIHAAGILRNQRPSSKLNIFSVFGHWPHPIFVSCVRCAAAVLARREALYRRHRP